MDPPGCIFFLRCRYELLSLSRDQAGIERFHPQRRKSIPAGGFWRVSGRLVRKLDAGCVGVAWCLGIQHPASIPGYEPPARF